MEEINIGSSFDSWLREEGIHDRFPTPENNVVTLSTLQKAAAVVSRQLRRELL